MVKPRGIDLAPGAVIALASVLTGHLFVLDGWPLWAAGVAGVGIGLAAGALAAALVVGADLPPFIATLGVMGIARGGAFLITEGRFYDLSQRLPAATAPLGVPLSAWPGMVMVAFATVFQFVMVRTAVGRHVLATGGNEVAARYAGVSIGRVKAFVYVTGGALAALSGVVLAVVQGQGKADLATGYELDIIAAAVVGGASPDVLVGLAGGRIVASAMIGHDGHRGTMYYVSVDPARHGHGLGAELVAAAEAWLKARGVWKVNLLVRAGNEAVLGFYDRQGYAMGSSVQIEKWIDPDKRGDRS